MSSPASSSANAESASAFDVKYCSLCDAYFYSDEMLKAHIKGSSRHPKCVTCNKSFLNKNSLRNHYVLSRRHHYCRACDKHFKRAGGLRIHLDVTHEDSDTEDGSSTLPDDWEDQQALSEIQALGAEIPIPHEDSVAHQALPALTTGFAALNLTAKSKAVLRPKCPICLSGRKTMCATRCGHVFCSGCITHALNESNSCPTCRQPAVAEQLRTLDLRIYGSA